MSMHIAMQLHVVPLHSRIAETWRSLNWRLAPKDIFSTIGGLKLILAVWYGIAIRTCRWIQKILADFNLAVYHQTT